ncbi:hypothetical protein [Shewanella sp.]|uniref:hypothetical protein n=1 Tax=Shewanella sp. TaxID=50422 RepID=UPI0035667519
MEQLLPHIQISTDESGRVFLVVGDYELFDYIDDYLSDSFDIVYEYRKSAERVGGEIITMYFPSHISIAHLKSAVSSLTADEVEEIYHLNN